MIGNKAVIKKCTIDIVFEKCIISELYNLRNTALKLDCKVSANL